MQAVAFGLKIHLKKLGGYMKTSIIKRNNGNTAMPARTVNNWVDQLFQDNLNRFFNDDLWGFSGIEHQVNVPVNLQETDKSYEMSIVAPGLRKEDFKLNVNGEVLTISYEQKEEQNDENKEQGWLRKEYKMQSFSRSFNLDDTVDVNNISASYDNGILHLSLPKKESARKITKSIEVK
jgi:HSP20 family protein